MPFSPASVDLTGERVSSSFGEMRDGCPHKGMDITSSNQPKTFTAGIFGTVGRPTGTGDWGTITVNPMHAPTDRVQYLHTSSTVVAPGQKVVPWSVLGTTGDVAPPGTGITGIHLHLHVETAGTGPACWNGRFFTDPATYATPDMFRGQWRNQYANQQGILFVEYDNTFVIRNSLATGLAGYARSKVTASYQNCKWVYNFGWDLLVTAHNLDGTISVASRNGTQNRPVSCGITGGWRAVDGDGKLRLDTASMMSIVGNGPVNGTFHRASSLAPEAPDPALPLSPEKGTPFLAEPEAEIAAEFDLFSPQTSTASLDAATEHQYLARASAPDRALYYGALPD